jgi:hypothetical protein
MVSMYDTPDLTHPWWDGPTCTAGQLVDLSGGLRAAVVMDHHKSSPVRVERDRHGDATVTVYATASATESIDETVVTAEVEIVRSEYLSIEGYTFEAGQLRKLIDALGSVLPILERSDRLPARVRRREELGDCPAWCARDLPNDTHQRLTGDVEMLGQAFTVEATQYGDDSPSVTFMHHADDNTSLVSLTVGEARELAYALLGAAGLIEAGAR